MTSSDVTLLALHGLRLTGLAEAVAVAEVTGADPGVIEVELKSLADDDLVLRRDHPRRSGWILSALGRRRGAELVAAELEAIGAERAVEALYSCFCQLNPQLLALCSQWQLVDAGRHVLNDHLDPVYDQSVIDQLSMLDDRAQPILAALAALLDRFGRYGPRLHSAVGKIHSGELDYFTKPVLASYHTVWFELHEDLLATLGLDRASETARQSRSTITPELGFSGPPTTSNPPRCD